jgi:hypothetical protein
MAGVAAGRPEAAAAYAAADNRIADMAAAGATVNVVSASSTRLACGGWQKMVLRVDTILLLIAAAGHRQCN